MRLAEYRKEIVRELKIYVNEREAEAHLSLLFEKILKLNRAELIIAKDRVVNSKEKQEIRQVLDELKSHRPVDYIFNESVFFGREFFVDERVLIPRSETEELVQWILEGETRNEILDIGSGSGCISITLAQEGDFKKIDALDVSEEANQVARLNARRHNLELKFKTLNILNQVPDHIYDIVVSNPPYVKREELDKLDKNVVEYEPEIALSPEGDPLLFYKRMIALAPEILRNGGRFYWEIHEDLGREIMQLLKKNNFQEIELKQDMYGRDRLVKAIFNA